MGKKKSKVKKKCCGKYLKSGKHCKDCPLLIKESAPKKAKNTDKKKAAGKKKKTKNKKTKKWKL